MLTLGTCDGSPFSLPLSLLPKQLVCLVLLNAEINVNWKAAFQHGLGPMLAARRAQAEHCSPDCAQSGAQIDPGSVFDKGSGASVCTGSGQPGMHVQPLLPAGLKLLGLKFCAWHVEGCEGTVPQW